MILALSLVISGVPVTYANAAEFDESEIMQEKPTNVDMAAETIATEAADEDRSDAQENEEAERTDRVNQTVKAVKTGNNIVQIPDASRFHVNSNGKAVGSDGVTYDDVVYLSLDTVMAFDSETQDDYLMLCDVAAKWATDGIEDIVIAVDDDGNLKWSCYVPGVMLAETQNELVEEALSIEAQEVSTSETNENTETELAEIITDESVSGEENVPEESNVDLSEEAAAETTEEEKISEEKTEDTTEASTEEDAALEETAIEETTEEDTALEETTIEETIEEASTEEEATSEETTENGFTSEETVEDELTLEETTEEASTEEETVSEETTEDETVELKAENIELIPTFVNEQIEIPDDVDVEVIDLGYGMNNTFNATLPSDSYFSKQLTSNELKVYNVARKSLTSGNTTFDMPANIFTANDAGLDMMIDATMRALSAVILTDTEKVDWLAIPGGFGITGDILYNGSTNKIVKCKIAVEKSNYYNKQLDDNANTKVAKLVVAAQEYAVENYPTLPAYGVVEYFDKWICENNFYNTPGGVMGELGPEVYYYCHSPYGALLNGYAVCESYAKAMSRLLDAVGIPNMYVTGYAYNDPVNGGHAWNYVQMPDMNWYLLDSTWNNPSDTAANASQTSTKEFLLSAGDGYHTATGSEYQGQTKGFTFPELSNAKYVPVAGKIEFDKTTMDLAVKQKDKLTCDNGEINNAFSTWSSSDISVAKVDNKGNVTAVAPGTAVITLSTLATAGVELKAECEVKVYQVKDINSSRTGKATDTIALGTNGSPAEIDLNVNVGENSPYTAQELVEKELPINNAKNAAKFADVTASSSKTDIAEVTAQLTGNTIKVIITPKNAGSSVVTVNFGDKKSTIKVTVGELIDAKMFDINWAAAGVDDKTMSIDYTGKAIKPKVTKKSDAEYKPVKFKTIYVNNINAGIASVIIAGTGKYGGEIKYDFEIKKLPINSGSVDFKLNKSSNVYNAGSNPAKTTVKYLNGNKKVSLKLNTDYQIVYKNGENATTNPINAGEYTLTVRGIGSYEGEYEVSSAKYTISQCEINKAKVAFTISNKAMMPKVNAVVKLGKNVLPKSNYEIRYYSDNKYENEVNAAALKSKTTYYVVITAKGENMKAGAKMYTKKIKTK